MRKIVYQTATDDVARRMAQDALDESREKVDPAGALAAAEAGATVTATPGKLLKLDEDGEAPLAVLGKAGGSAVDQTARDAAAAAQATADAKLAPEGDGSGLAGVTKPDDLAAVATTGAYGDLSGTPALGALAAQDRVAASEISDATQAGRALLMAADAAVQRTALELGAAATADMGTGANHLVQLDGSGRLPAVDGSQLTGLASRGTGVVEIPAEVTLTPVAEADWRYLDTTNDVFASTTAPSSPPAANTARLPSSFTVTGGSVGASETLFGVEGRYYNMIHSYRVIEIADVSETIESGDYLYFIALAGLDSQHSSYSSGLHFSVYLNEESADQMNWETDSNGDAVDATGAFATIGLTEPTTANDSYNGATLVGSYANGDIYLLQFRVQAKQQVTTNLTFGISAEDDNDNAFPVVALYTGKGPVDLTTGDAEGGKLLLPGSVSTNQVTLRAAASHEPFQTVSINSDTDLLLPAAPAAGQPPRETRLRVEATSGVLALPSGSEINEFNARTAGQMGAGLLYVEQRPDGGAALIVVE